MHNDSSSKDKDGANDACTSCVGHNRRAFVQTTVSAVAAFVGLSLFSSDDAFAQISAVIGAVGLAGEVKYPIPAADGVNIDTKNDVIIARSAGKAYAFALSCPHQNTELRWYPKDRRFQCPKHKSRYQPTGEFIDGRATRNMDRLNIKLDGTSLLVDVDHEIHSDEQAAQWAAAVVTLPA
jgi:Rieske Fe-S protein